MFRSSRLFLAGVPRVGASMTPLAVAPRLALASRASSSATTAQADKKPAYQASTSNKIHIYHYSSYALLGLLPAGILLAPTYSFPVDLALNVVIPYHVYTGLTVIVNDYIYAPSARYIAKAALLVLTILTGLGLSKINFKDVGISQGLKLMWYPPTQHK